jgi:hypothetical protein
MLDCWHNTNTVPLCIVQTLYETHKDEPFVILGFPCDQCVCMCGCSLADSTMNEWMGTRVFYTKNDAVQLVV